jgi:hypothetical protein
MFRKMFRKCLLDLQSLRQIVLPRVYKPILITKDLLDEDCLQLSQYARDLFNFDLPSRRSNSYEKLNHYVP